MARMAPSRCASPDYQECIWISLVFFVSNLRRSNLFRLRCGFCIGCWTARYLYLPILTAITPHSNTLYTSQILENIHLKTRAHARLHTKKKILNSLSLNENWKTCTLLKIFVQPTWMGLKMFLKCLKMAYNYSGINLELFLCNTIFFPKTFMFWVF